MANGHSLIINPSQGIYVLGYPSLQGIDRVKTNTPLLMRRENGIYREEVHEPRHLLFLFCNLFHRIKLSRIDELSVLLCFLPVSQNYPFRMF